MLKSEVNQKDVDTELSKIMSGLRIMPWVALALLVLTLFAAAMLNREPRIDSYIKYPDGRTEPFFAMTQRFLPNDVIESFVRDAVVAMYTIRGDRPGDTFKAASRYLVEEGMDSFRQDLDTNGLIDSLRTNGMLSIPTLLGQPIVENGPSVLGLDLWFVRVPLRIDYLGRKVASKKLLLSIVVVRTRSGANLQGVGITKVESLSI